MKKTLLNLFTGYKQPPMVRTLIFGVVCTLLMTGSVLAASHSVEPEARYSGSYGLQLVFDDTDPSYVEDDSPVSEKRYRARFYVDMSALTLGAGDSFTLFIGYHDADANGPDDGDEIEFELSVLESSGEKLLMARVWQDDDSFVPLASGIAIEDGWHSIEIDWETGFSGNPGLFDIWLDGEKQTGIAGLDNEEAAVDFVRWGAVFGIPEPLPDKWILTNSLRSAWIILA